MDSEIERLVREKHKRIADAERLVLEQEDQCRLLLENIEPLVSGCGLPLDILVVPREIRVEHTCQIRSDGPSGKFVYKSLRGGYPGSPIFLSKEECIGKLKNDLADLIVSGLPKPRKVPKAVENPHKGDISIIEKHLLYGPIGIVLFWIAVLFVLSMLGYFIEWLHR